MSFLRKRDYFSEIREVDLDAILKQISQTTAFTIAQVRQDNEEIVQEIVETMIQHRYDVRKIFVDIITFVKADTYQINDLIEYSEPAYVAADTYITDDRVSFEQTINSVLNDDIYNANQAIAAGETPITDPDKWDKITENFSLYYVVQPTSAVNPDTAFAYTSNNFTGNHDTITGWDKTKTIFLERDDQKIIMYYLAADRTNKANSIGIVDYNPVSNTFPDNLPIARGNDRENTVKGDLSIIGFIPDGTEWDVAPSNAFVKGDNRSKIMRRILISLSIFDLHKLINPRNIPDLRLEAKDDAMELLRKISSGKIQADLPLYKDEQRGQSITFGSNPKVHHVY